jgi:hypothetical protein
MMFMCTTKFDIEEKELAFASECLSREEKEAAAEERTAQDQDQLEPISDNEEEFVAPSQTPTTNQPAPNRRQKRARSVNEHEASQSVPMNSDDDAATIPLPVQPNTQQRMSGRARKIPKSLEGFDVSRR